MPNSLVACSDSFFSALARADMGVASVLRGPWYLPVFAARTSLGAYARGADLKDSAVSG